MSNRSNRPGTELTDDELVAIISLGLLSETPTGFHLAKDATGGIVNIPESGTVGSSAWGDITGTLSDQTDLQTALDSKATPADITTAINSLVDAAPGTLDTLNELAAALGDDPNFATTVTNSLAGKQATLVSGTNIKTINGTSLLGSGDISIASSGNEFSISQTSHGLSVGNVIRLNGISYVKALADNGTNAEVVGIVSQVTDANNFKFITGGKITGLSSLTAGVTYFLSDTTSGLLTSTEPTTSGSISKPILIADSTTSGYVFNMRGVQVTNAMSVVEYDNGNSGTSKTITWDNSPFQKITMTGNCTITMTAPTNIGRYQLKLIQDGTGSRTATFSPTPKVPSGTSLTLSTGANQYDIVTMYWDGSNYSAVMNNNFA